MASVSNHSRNYYLSNENVSEDIRESIEYSMNFQQGVSGTGSEIGEMISGSNYASQSRQSKFNPKSKPALPKPEIIQEQHNYNAEVIEGHGNNSKAIYLGDMVYQIIKQRYFETNKITTDDPEVLYDFFLGQRKNLSSMKPISQQQIQKQMPSMQRKLLVKQKFQNILTYYPNDVYYSLCYFSNKLALDKKTTQNVELLNRQIKKKEKKKVTKKQMDQIVEHLYKTKKGGRKQEEKDQSVENKPILTKQENQKEKRLKFGRNLSEHFQNSYREKGSPFNIETPERLHTFWSDLYERQQYGIEWDEDTAYKTIQRYMYEQVDDLMKFAGRKLGFKCGKADSLFKFYQQNWQKLQKFIFIPINSFQEYIKIFNKIELQKQNQEQLYHINHEKQSIKKQKIQETKKFGRPVSATPLTILSQPKNHSTAKQMKQLSTKYPHNPLIQQMQAEENLKKARYAFEYGIHDLTEEVKTKQWVKIDVKGKHSRGGHDGKITRQLMSSYGTGGWLSHQEDDRLMELFAEQNISQNIHWKNLGPIMHEAMLVKAYQHRWFVQCIVKYLERVLGEQNLKLQTNNVIFRKLFHYLTDEVDQYSRQSELSKLQTIIMTSQTIADRTKQINSLAANNNKGSANYKKQRRLVNSFLQQKAIEWVKARVQQKKSITLSAYLKQLYQQLLKEHKDYVVRNFNVVLLENKQIPKLLKYQFFKLIKQINPITLQHDAVPRSHAWVPPKSKGLLHENISYKTFNQIAQQKKTKASSEIYYQAEGNKQKNQLWGRKKAKDRQIIMMAYQDAKQCTFHPKVSKKGM